MGLVFLPPRREGPGGNFQTSEFSLNPLKKEALTQSLKRLNGDRVAGLAFWGHRAYALADIAVILSLYLYC